VATRSSEPVVLAVVAAARRAQIAAGRGEAGKLQRQGAVKAAPAGYKIDLEEK
jgi:hypothetical protein